MRLETEVSTSRPPITAATARPARGITIGSAPPPQRCEPRSRPGRTHGGSIHTGSGRRSCRHLFKVIPMSVSFKTSPARSADHWLERPGQPMRRTMKPRIHVITLAVADLDRALSFYRDGLGFRTE